MCEIPSFRASNPNNRQSKLGFYLFSPRLWTKPPQLLGMRIGKIRNERSVENAVDRSVRADADGKRQQSHEGKSWILPQQPETKAEIVPEIFHPIPPDYFASRITTRTAPRGPHINWAKWLKMQDEYRGA
jgi:hypothetical protein